MLEEMLLVDTSQLSEEFVKNMTDIGYLKYCAVWADQDEEDYPEQKMRFLGDFLTPNQKVRITNTGYKEPEFAVVVPLEAIQKCPYYSHRYSESQILELAKEILTYSQTLENQYNVK